MRTRRCLDEHRFDSNNQNLAMSRLDEDELVDMLQRELAKEEARRGKTMRIS